MDDHKLTMATIGGHGFGAKVATATAINHMNRFTGVICLEGGPLDHRYYEAYQELVSYVEAAKSLKLENMQVSDALKKLNEKIPCSKWRSIFAQNISTEKGAP
jgi:pimeloyl-ACP methyl ester carboxylesterase